MYIWFPAVKFSMSTASSFCIVNIGVKEDKQAGHNREDSGLNIEAWGCHNKRRRRYLTCRAAAKSLTDES